jgi:hypothetical protein
MVNFCHCVEMTAGEEKRARERQIRQPQLDAVHVLPLLVLTTVAKGLAD